MRVNGSCACVRVNGSCACEWFVCVCHPASFGAIL